MKLGIFCMPLHRPERPHAETYQEDLELMTLADRLGFAETWIGEHFTLPWENMPCPEIFISRALGVTERMTFGTGVNLPHYHDPVHLAHRIAMLDHLSQGRIYFGIGAGGSPTDSEMFGIDVEAGSLGERMQESVEIILNVWAGEPFEYKGKFFSATIPEDVPDAMLGFHMRPYQQPHPPVAVAGSSPYSSTLKYAGGHGWWPMSTPFMIPPSIPSHWEVVEKAAQENGKSVSRSDWRISREVHVADNGQKAREEALNGPMGKFFVDYWIPLLSHGARGLEPLKVDPDMPDEAVSPEYMLENLWIVGDPDECTRQIKKLYDDVGGFGVLLPLAHDWGRDTPQWHHSMELMTTEVLPALEKLNAG